MNLTDRELVIIGSNEYAEYQGRCYFRSGLEQQIDDLAKHFSRAYHYSPKSTDSFVGYEFSRAVEVRPFCIGHHKNKKELWKRRKEFFRGMQQIYTEHRDAVFMVFIPDSYIGLIAAHVLKKNKACFFVRVTADHMRELKTRHASIRRIVLYYVLKPVYYLYMKWLLAGVPQVYTGERLYSHSEKSISITSSSFFSRDIQENPVEKKKSLSVYYVGRFEPVKGLQYLVQAMEFVTADVHLSIIGFGNKHDTIALKKQIQQLEKSDRVKVIGQVPFGEELFFHYDRADALVVPSLQETQGKTYLEAMARSTAVIASNIGGICRLIQDRKNGILVPPREPRAIAQALDEIASNIDLRKKIVHHGLQTAQESTIDAGTEKILTHIRTYLS